MKPENFPYFLEVHFDIDRVSEASYPKGIKMYFTSLEDAFSRCLQINPYGFVDGINVNLPEYHPEKRSSISSITISGKDDVVLLDVKLHPQALEGGTKSPGIYYYFPEGITSFEKQMGSSLKDFKGYDQNKDYLLVTHVVGFKDLKHVLAYTNRKQRLEEMKSNSGVFPVYLNRVYFGYSNESPRSVDPNPYQEVFYHKDVAGAIRHLLSINFNQLEEDFAWERDQPFYYYSCKVYEGSYERAALIQSSREHFHFAGTYIDDPGVYLNFKSKFSDGRLDIMMEPFKVEKYPLTIYKVGTFIKEDMQFLLDKRLELFLKPMKRKLKAASGRKL